jgi:hypothetical protein
MESKKNDRQGKKDTKGKVRMELLPMEALRSVAEILTFGAEKYGANNWQNIDDGYNLFWGALLRHKTLKDMGEEFDKESGKSHDAHIACNALFMLYYSLQKQKELNKLKMIDDISYVCPGRELGEWWFKTGTKKKEKPPYKAGGLCDRITDKEQEYDVRCYTLYGNTILFDMNKVDKSKNVISALQIADNSVKVVTIVIISCADFDKANEKQKEFYISAMNFFNIK